MSSSFNRHFVAHAADRGRRLKHKASTDDHKAVFTADELN